MISVCRKGAWAEQTVKVTCMWFDSKLSVRSKNKLNFEKNNQVEKLGSSFFALDVTE